MSRRMRFQIGAMGFHRLLQFGKPIDIVAHLIDIVLQLRQVFRRIVASPTAML